MSRRRAARANPNPNRTVTLTLTLILTRTSPQPRPHTLTPTPGQPSPKTSPRAAIGLLLEHHTVTTLDLRDSRLTNQELRMLRQSMSRSLTASESLATILLAGNPLGAADLAAALRDPTGASGGDSSGAASGSTSGTSGTSGTAVEASAHRLSKLELNISRTELGGHGAADVSELAGLASVFSADGRVGSLAMASVELADDAAASFISHLGRPMSSPTASTLATLDLSHNCCGARFASVLKASFPSLPLLTTLNLSYNPLGAAAGGMAAEAALTHPSLRALDLSSTNLCDCSPTYRSSSASPSPWTSAAIQLLAEALGRSAVTDLYLHGNELAGVWSERVCGEPTIRIECTTSPNPNPNSNPDPDSDPQPR